MFWQNRLSNSFCLLFRHLKDNKKMYQWKIHFCNTFKYSYVILCWLKKIIFFSNSEKNNAKLKIRFFQLEDSILTNDLMEEDIIVTVKKGMRKNVIDISKYKLRIPKNGVLVGLEWLIIPENFYEFNLGYLGS